MDDGRGVGEPLNESEPIRTTHLLTFTQPAISARHQRPQSLFMNNPPVILFGQGFTGDAGEWFSTHRASYEPFVNALPPNVHLLNLQTMYETGEVLLRLHHLYAVNEDSEYSQNARVDLQTLFRNLRIVNVEEVSLSANQKQSELHRLQWRTADFQSSTRRKVAFADQQDMIVELTPMQIRSFVLRVVSQ